MFVEEIKKLPLNTAIEGLFALTKIELIPFKQKEGNFLACQLTDRTDSIRGIIWEDADKEKKKLYEKIVVKIKGQVARHADKPQVIIESLEEVKQYDRSLLMKALPKEERIKLRKRFLQISETIKDPLYKDIWQYIIDFKEFWSCPGGKGDTHHEYLGGLAEHVITMMNDSAPMIRQYNLDKELLLTGILVHDLGKTKAYSWDVVTDMTDEGRLLGHSVLGIKVLTDLMDNQTMVSPFCEEKVTKLFHMVMSHHGEHSEVKPQFREAVALSILDGASAAFQRIDKLEKEVVDGSSWTRFDWSTQRHYYLGKRKKKEKEIKKESKTSNDEEII